MEALKLVYYVDTHIKVLILIIMEDTHGGFIINTIINDNIVLILIIMEDTHGVVGDKPKGFDGAVVLILIIMEDTHGVLGTFAKGMLSQS